MKKRKTGAINHVRSNYDGKEFKSKLELFCYKLLKDSELEFSYEGESFVLEQSFTHVGRYGKKGTKAFSIKDKQHIREITYTPDFVSHKHRFIIETKGFVPSQHSFHIRFKLFLKHLANSNMGDYAIYIPRNQGDVKAVINDIISRK